jgi:hypothetical protein
MGLGPMVCIDCRLFARRVKTNDGPGTALCPMCNKDSGNIDYLWMFTEEEQEKIQVNDKFYRFVSGQDDPWA